MSQRGNVSTLRERAQASRVDSGDDILYDELEQEDEIQNLQKSIVHLGQRYRLVNNTLGCILTVLYGGFAVIQVVRPYTLRHHAIFQGSVEASSSIALGELSSALTLLLSTVTVARFVSDHVLVCRPLTNRFTWKHAMNCSIMLAGIQLLYWMAAFLSLQQFVEGGDVAWGLIWWKPAIPMIWFLSSARMIDSMSKLQIDLGSMHRLKYRHKKL